MNLNMPYYPAELKLSWNNILLSAQYERMYNANAKTRQQIYITSYSNDTKFVRGNEQLLLPSKITTLGITNHSQLHHWGLGYELRYHDIEPQSPALVITIPAGVPIRQKMQQNYLHTQITR